MKDKNIIDHIKQRSLYDDLANFKICFTRGFIVVDIDALQLIRIVSFIGSVGSDPVLLRNHLPELKFNVYIIYLNSSLISKPE